MTIDPSLFAKVRRIASLPAIRSVAVLPHSTQHAPVAMLALWSRVTQNPGTCRCVSCVSNAGAVARRRGQRGLGGSWVLGTPTSTFLYTTVFAAALTIDARAKSDRNRQWDDAFAQLRDALDRPPNVARPARGAAEPDQTSLPAAEHDSNGIFEESDWQSVRRVANMDLGSTGCPAQREASQLDAAAQTWQDLHFDSRLPGAQALAWPANTGRDLIPHNLPPQSLWAPDVLRWKAMRRRHTRKKMAMQELATGFLIHNLVKHAGLARFSASADDILKRLSPHIRHIASSPGDEIGTAREAFLADMERLHLTDVNSSAEHIANARVHVASPGIPSYHQDADGDFYEICKQMNDSIAQLLRQCGKGNDREKALVVAKICHNLLVSTAAPDLHTFNILIAGFKLWRNASLVDDAIAAFFASKIRPNELVCTQILNHYSTQSRPNDFSRFVARMRGVGDALALANPAINVNEAGQDRLVRINEDKVYQKVHPTPMVFAALIDGVMKFAGFDRALDVYYEMKADGWGLAIPALTRLLGDCIRRADWEGGTYVWEEINSIKTKVKPSYVAKAYHHMLSLCSVTGNTVAFNQVLAEIAKRGFDQRSIINAAMKTTRWAQHKKDNMAPAWAADNLMIAVSGYLNDAKPSNNTFDEHLLDDMDFEDVPYTQQSSEESPAARTMQSNTGLLTKDNPIDTREAWSSWVEHEFGERPKDPKS